MSRVRDIAIIVLAGVVLLSVVGAVALAKLGVSLPSWTNVGVEESALEGEYHQGRPVLSLSAVSSGEFQQKAEAYCADHVPLRNQALIGSAALQRQSAALMAALLGTDCYPTFFGSEYAYVGRADALIEIPGKKTDQLEKLSEFAEGLSDVADRYPGKRFVVLVPEHGPGSSINPLVSLVADPFASDEAIGVLAEGLSGHPNVFFGTDEGTYDTLGDYFHCYYRTDHHWNARGAASVYNAGAEKAGLPLFDYGEDVPVEGPAFSGSHARFGRDLVAEQPFDTSSRFADVSIELDDGTVIDGDDHAFFDGRGDLARYQFYECYYTHGVEYSGPGRGTALLVCDSYGYALGRIVAKQYETVHYREDLYFETTEGNLADRIEELDPDDVIIAAALSDYCSQTTRIPDYFE